MIAANRVQNFFTSNPLNYLNSLLLQEVRRHQAALDQHAAIHQGHRVWASNSAIHFEIDLPGYQPEDFQVTLEKDLITVNIPSKGNREGEPSGKYLIQERTGAPETLQLKLPFRPEADAVQTTYSRGVLKISAATPEADQPRQLEVRSGE